MVKNILPNQFHLEWSKIFSCLINLSQDSLKEDCVVDNQSWDEPADLRLADQQIWRAEFKNFLASNLFSGATLGRTWRRRFQFQRDSNLVPATVEKWSRRHLSQGDLNSGFSFNSDWICSNHTDEGLMPETGL
mmetsp:Transcript_17854/g.23512  ORF Transcript_17854/g.23512 Transcript_17854/m.23512 type:complete len:133 (+) Transcript_17854:432-830(+)